MGKTILVSNRLPVTVQHHLGSFKITPSVGGLATALQCVTSDQQVRWVGWPGTGDHLGSSREVVRQLSVRGLVPVFLNKEEIQGFYQGYCNAILWPLCHYLFDRLPLQIDNWDEYRAANSRYARAVLSVYENGDTVWVHDYHLMLLPAMLRKAQPDARIGFFLHTPFPSFEVFRILPHRTDLIEGMLGADLIGFHTAGYLREFSRAALHLVGAGTAVEQIHHAGRLAQLGVFPVGIDRAKFAKLAAEKTVHQEAVNLRDSAGGQLAVAIDRLDYTKGVPRRLLAFETLLERHPEMLGRVQLIQVAVPSRTKVKAYQRFRSQVDRLVGRINGRFGTAHWTPIVYLYRSLPEHMLVALYRAADVMLVTPVRDGLNLVSKEFIASRDDNDGVLVLSEFAGAAAELAEAVHVNPYDIEGTAQAYHHALTMDPAEREIRMRALRDRVINSEIPLWSDRFLARLYEARAANDASVKSTSAHHIEASFAQMRGAARLELLLDYDGTLVPFAGTPELARPDGPLLDLLRGLAERPGTRVHVVSGRGRDTFDRWLGTLPLHLYAEHGHWSRAPGENWISQPMPRPAWYAEGLTVLKEFAQNTPGSLIEEKAVGLAWHYRMVDPELGQRQANELRIHLAHLFSNTPVEILAGQKVVELRPHGNNKGLIARRVAGQRPDHVLIAAFGDDATDEDLFCGLPPEALTFHVGQLASKASYRLDDVATARRHLQSLLETPPQRPFPPSGSFAHAVLISTILQ